MITTAVLEAGQGNASQRAVSSAMLAQVHMHGRKIIADVIIKIVIPTER